MALPGWGGEHLESFCLVTGHCPRLIGVAIIKGTSCNGLWNDLGRQSSDIQEWEQSGKRAAQPRPAMELEEEAQER